MNKNIKQIFIRYLKKNNAYDKYMSDFYSNIAQSSRIANERPFMFDEYIESILKRHFSPTNNGSIKNIIKDILDKSFIWVSVEYGELWSDLYDKCDLENFDYSIPKLNNNIMIL